MLCLVVAAAVLAEVTATNYCNQKLCPSQATHIHTMCKYTSDKPAAACGDVLNVGCTKADKSTIVKLHNTIRQKVASGKVYSQPPAASMPDLVWDDELAQVAQRWVNQCKVGSDECRNVDRFNVGQNLAEEESTKSDTKLEDLIHLWFGEFKHFNPEEVSKYTGKEVNKAGRYTQLVWASTTKVGCGCIKHRDNRNYKAVITRLVCNYGPRGNVIGEPVYKKK